MMAGNSEALLEQAEQQRAQSDTFRAAQVVVSEVLERYRALAYETTGVKSVRISRDTLSEIRKDPTVPDDKRCWLLDIGRLLCKLDRECPSRQGKRIASLILGQREIRDRYEELPRDWKFLARIYGISVDHAQEIHERAIWHLAWHLKPFGQVPLHWKDYEEEAA